MIKAKIKDIQTCDDLHVVEFDCDGVSLKMMSLELGQNVSIEKQVLLNIKPTHVDIAKKLYQSTCANAIKCSINSIESGELLACLSLQANENLSLEAIVLEHSLSKLQLSEGDEVYAFLPASELSIEKIIS